MSDPPQPRPENSIGGGLQHERTALAWERTAIAMMVAGVLLARYASAQLHFLLGLFGVVQVVGGGALLYWAAIHDEELHDPARPASAVPKVALTRVIGISTVGFCAFSTLVAIVIGVR